MAKSTEDEKFELAVLAGCATVVFEDDKGAYRMKTKYPCGFYHDGSKWVVVEAVNG